MTFKITETPRGQKTAEKFSVLEYCNKKQKRCPDVRAKVESVKDAKERGDP